MDKKKIGLTGFFIILIDQVSKYVFFDGVLNTGGVWGIGRGMSWVLYVLLGLGVVGYFFLRSQNRWERWGYVLVLAGGISNLLDRIFYLGVRDFIYWPILNVYGNVADIFLVVGVVVIFLSSFEDE